MKEYKLEDSKLYSLGGHYYIYLRLHKNVYFILINIIKLLVVNNTTVILKLICHML